MVVDAGGLRRPQVFGAGVSLGMFAGILIGSLVTLWLGEAVAHAVQRLIERLPSRGERINFELLLQ